MQSLQAYTEEAESLLYHAKKYIPKFGADVSNQKQSLTIHQKLEKIRTEELSSTFSLADPVTIINDVNELITTETKLDDKFSAKLELEKNLLLANYGPLCLNPKPSIAIANQKLHYSKYFLNTHKLKYKARKHTLLGIAQKKRQEQFTKCFPSISNLIEFISKKKASQTPKTKVVKKLLPECPVSDEFWTEAARTVLELAKPIERPTETNQTVFNSKIIEEYVIETRAEARLQFMIKLTIFQRNSDYEYIGEIQQSRELSTGGFHNISYSFPLGTHELATRYVLEFTNVYTERGKIRINFTHKVPGKPPKAFVTSGLRMEATNITLSNFLTTTANAHNVNTAHTVNVTTGQRVIAKRIKMQNAARVLSGNQQVVTSPTNATVIAAAPSNPSVTTNINAQPVIRLSLSSLSNQVTPVIQQRSGKNIAGRIVTPANIKTASLVNNIQPVTVTSANSIQIGNNVHNITAVHSLLNNNSTQSVASLRMKTNNRRNVVVGGIQSLTVNASNEQAVNESQTINSTKIQTVSTSQGNVSSSSHLSAGELQTLAGTLTAAPTIGTIQLTRNVQTLPAASVHLVTNSNSSQTINSATKTATLNSIQVNNNSNETLVAKGQKIMRLSNNQEATSQTNVGLPMSALSALLSGKPMNDGSVSGTSKGNFNLMERISPATASTSQSASSSSATTINLASTTSTSVSLQNVQAQLGAVQQLQVIGSVQRNKLGAQIPKQVAARNLLNTNCVKLTAPPPNAVVQQHAGSQEKVLSVAAKQQLQLALQKQAAQLQLHQGLTAAGGLKVAQKRRRSSVATDGS
ncbi:hypothetical protein PGB90_004100 [Kerria lacca]